jgi:hypothetical protein
VSVQLTLIERRTPNAGGTTTTYDLLTYFNAKLGNQHTNADKRWEIGAPFNEDEVRRVLSSGELEADVMREAEGLARRQRGQGVPFFYFNGQPTFAGA